MRILKLKRFKVFVFLGHGTSQNDIAILELYRDLSDGRVVVMILGRTKLFNYY